MAEYFKTKSDLLAGTSYAEIIKNARREYHKIQKMTKRQPYVRSKYFNKDKVFVNTFWLHMGQKRGADQQRRLKYYVAAIELIRNTSIDSDSIFGRNTPNEILHRFYGQTASGKKFCVQIKQNKKNSRKDFISCFPVK